MNTLSYNKLNKYFQFPQTLNMNFYTTNYLNNNNIKNIDNNYNLKSIVIHDGTTDSGHYYLYSKNYNDKWFVYNDKIVKSVDLNDALNISFGNKDSNCEEYKKNAYIIVYEKVDKDNCEEYEGIKETLFNNIPKVNLKNNNDTLSDLDYNSESISNEDESLSDEDKLNNNFDIFLDKFKNLNINKKEEHL